MTDSCHLPPPPPQKNCGCQQNTKKSTDWLLWGSVIVLCAAYIAHYFFAEQLGHIKYLETFTHASFQLLNQMAWGLALGICFVGVLEKVPRVFVTSLLGKGGTFGGILRATGAGVLLDLCSHGILMVGMKLYQRGASLGQVMAFLIASPWNSLSLTLVLWALIGFKWMITFLLLSMVIAIISGIIFETLVRRGILPSNPHHTEIPKDFRFFKEAKVQLKKTSFNLQFLGSLLWGGLRGSTMILRWIFFGVILASLTRTLVSVEHFQTFFGATLLGLSLTIVVSTILEVCSEGSTPIAADILTRAKAPGNSFAFLMAGVSTDYTEVMLLKETTKSWKIAFFLPLVTLPQIILVAWVINQFT